MFRYWIVFICIGVEIRSDCLYPQWKSTCQKYCMDHQFYEIQLNQCYSQDPQQLTCKCSGKDLTETIQILIQNNSSLSSTSPSTRQVSEVCTPASSCSIGQSICHHIDTYCTCPNGSWMEISCPEGNICETQDTIASCHPTSTLREAISSTIQNRACFYLFIASMFIQVGRRNKAF